MSQLAIGKVITGGQTGVDQAGWRAAKRCGIPTGGCMPRGWYTEDLEPHPEFETLYGAHQHHSSPAYPPRTAENIELSRALVWIGKTGSPGGMLTLRMWNSTRPARGNFCSVVPYHWKDEEAHLLKIAEEKVAEMLRAAADYWDGYLSVSPFAGPVCVMVAGNRESSAPGIGSYAERLLVNVFERLGYKDQGEACQHPTA